MAKPVANSGYPNNPTGERLDVNPWFTGQEATLTAQAATMARYERFTNLEIATIISKGPTFFQALPEKIQVYCRERIANPEPPAMQTLTLVQVTSASERALQVEALRQTIPAEGLIRLLLMAACTGKLDGAAEELKPAERVKVMLSLLDRVLPLAKSIEVDDRSDKSDRKRRKLADLTASELNGMNEEEIRQLIAGARE